jgi:hypothetical protein
MSLIFFIGMPCWINWFHGSDKEKISPVKKVIGLLLGASFSVAFNLLWDTNYFEQHHVRQIELLIILPAFFAYLCSNLYFEDTEDMKKINEIRLRVNNGRFGSMRIGGFKTFVVVVIVMIVYWVWVMYRMGLFSKS